MFSFTHEKHLRLHCKRYKNNISFLKKAQYYIDEEKLCQQVLWGTLREKETLSKMFNLIQKDSKPTPKRHNGLYLVFF